MVLKKLFIRNYTYSDLLMLYLYMIPALKKPTVKPENIIKVKIVPSIPKSRIYPIFSKKRFLLILNPEANIIGGKHI